MDDSGELFNDAPNEDIGILSQASRRELLDISDSVVGNPVEPESSEVATSSQQAREDDDEPEASEREVDPWQLVDEEEEPLQVCLAMNEAMQELTVMMIEKAEAALRANQEKQRILEDRKKVLNSKAAMVKRKVPVAMFMPPYFKDQFNMCPPQNAEMRRKIDTMIYDPLLKEEKKWTENDLLTLKRSVKDSLIEQRLQPTYGQRDMIMERVRQANATTTPEERAEWNENLAAIGRKIEYMRKLSDKDVFTGDYDCVDWTIIAMVNFKGQRTPSSLKLKWCNEQCPQWSKEEWTASEVKKLYELAKNDFVSWTIVASQLGTRRTPWQCFEKYKSEISSEILKREWTQEEDDRLIKLVESLQLNGVIQWDKVTYHMAGRTRQQCRTRYLRTLDKTIKHGRWTDEEDLLLMCSVGRYGAKDWRKVAKGVPGRNDGQCRERWVNVLDRANRSEEWTMEEDEKLLYAVNMFGKGQWAKISTVLPGRNQRVCKARFRSLLTTKMRICAAQLSKIREAQASRGNIQRCNIRKQKDATFKEFNQLIGGNDETGESFCDQARSVALKDKFRYKLPEPEVRRVVEEGLQGIQKKYDNRDGDGASDSDDNMAEHLFNGIDRSAARKQQQWLPVEFDPDVTEADKCQRLTEALCQVIDKQDQMRAVTTQEAYESRAKAEVAEKLQKLLTDAVISRVRYVTGRGEQEDAEVEEVDEEPCTSEAAAERCRNRALAARLRREMQSAADAAAHDMLHPTAATTHAAELLLAELPRITQIAESLLQMNWSGDRLHSTDEVLTHLEDALKNNEDYLHLKELLRCLLLEPLMLIHSLEDDDRKKDYLTEQFNRARDELMADVNDGVVEPTRPEKKEKKPPVMKTAAKKPSTKTPVKRNRPSKVQKKPTATVNGAESPQPAAAAGRGEEAPPAWDDLMDHEEFPVDWMQDTVADGEEADTVAKKKTPAARSRAQTPPKTPARTRATTPPKTPARSRAKTPAKTLAKTPAKTPARSRKTTKRKANAEEEEDGEGVEKRQKEEAEESRGRGRPRSKSMTRATRPTEADEQEKEQQEGGGKKKEAGEAKKVKKFCVDPWMRARDEGEQEKEHQQKGEGDGAATVEAKTPAKRGRGRPPGSTKAAAVGEGDGSATVEAKTPAKRDRGRPPGSTKAAAATRAAKEREGEAKTPARRGRSTRNSLATTPTAELLEANEMVAGDADEELEAVAKSGRDMRGRPKTPAKRARGEEEEAEKQAPKTPARKGRSTRNSLASTPAGEMKIDDDVIGHNDEADKAPPPPTKGRSTRNSLASTPADEMMIDDVVAGNNDEVEKAPPPPMNGHSTFNSLYTTPIPEMPEELEKDTVAAEDTVDGAEEATVPANEAQKDTVDEQKKDAVAGEDSTVAAMDTMEGEQEDTMLEKEDDAMDTQEDTVDDVLPDIQDAVPVEKNTQNDGGKEDTVLAEGAADAMEEGDAEGTVDESQLQKMDEE